MEQGLPDAKLHFPFSYYPFPYPSPKYQNVLYLPKLVVIMAFLAPPFLWLVPILLATPIASLTRISKGGRYWVNTRKSVAGKLKSTRKKEEMSKSWGKKTRGGILAIKDSQNRFFEGKPFCEI